MVEQDGLGLVFEQQGNTGAAAYNQPTLQMGQTPFDVLAARKYQEQRVQEQRDYVAKQQADKERKALDMQLADIDLSKFPQANQQELAQDITQYKNDLVQYKVKGQDPTDPLQPAWEEAQNKKLALENKILEANKQGALIDEAMKALKADLDNPNPQLDREKSIAAIKAYYSAPNIESRRAIDPNSLLVRKAAPFDTYEAIKGITGETFADQSNYKVGTPEYEKAGKTKKFNEVKAKEYLKPWFENTEQGKANYEAGVKAGTWSTIDEAVKVNVERLKPTMKAESDFTSVTKEPKSINITDINNGNSDELMASLGTGTQNMTIPLYDVNGVKVKDTVVKLNNVVQLDDIKSTISWATAINPATGLPFEGAKSKGSFDLTSGALALPLVGKGSNRILPTDQGQYTYKDKKGKSHTIYGDQASIDKQLVDLDIGEFRPMIIGTAIEGNKQTDVIVPAEAGLVGTNDKNKALTTGQKALYIYKKNAEDKNKKTTTTVKTIPASTVKGLVGKKGYEGYTEKELIDYYKSQGYTIQ